MVKIKKCLKVQNGIMAIAEGILDNNKGIFREKSNISVNEDGISIIGEEYEMALTSGLVDHLLNTDGYVYFYYGDSNDCEYKLATALLITKDVLYEAKGAYSVMKKDKYDTSIMDNAANR